MIEFFSALKKILKGELKVDLDKGVIEYRGRRLISIPADTANAFIETLRKYVGDAADLIFAIEGEATGRVVREMFGWGSGAETLKELGEVAKLGGFGVIKVIGGEEGSPCIEISNLPVRITRDVASAYQHHIEGFLMGLCLEPKSVTVEKEDVIRACVRPLPPGECK